MISKQANSVYALWKFCHGSCEARTSTQHVAGHSEGPRKGNEARWNGEGSLGPLKVANGWPSLLGPSLILEGWWSQLGTAKKTTWMISYRIYSCKYSPFYWWTSSCWVITLMELHLSWKQIRNYRQMKRYHGGYYCFKYNLTLWPPPLLTHRMGQPAGAIPSNLCFL